DRVVPVCVFPIEDGFETLNAGVREKNVEPAESCMRLVGRSTKSAKIALVKARFAPASARGFHQLAGLRQFSWCRGCHLNGSAYRLSHLDAHHVGALAGKGNRSGAPNPAGSASDYCGFASQSAWPC